MGKPVRAKMYLNQIGSTKWGTTVELQVVSRGKDNKEWSAASPTGTLKLGIANERAAEQFSIEDVQRGREYFITIEPVDDDLQGEEGMGD